MPARSGTVIGIMDRIAKAITDVDSVVAHAKTAEGKVRNPKLLLQAIRELRCCLEAAQKMVEGVHRIDRVEHFNKMIIAEVSRESPACAERILMQIDRLAIEWIG